MGMSPRAKIAKGRFAPTIKILTPANNHASTQGVKFKATVTALNAMRVDVSKNVKWASDMDGPVGNGKGPFITLSSVGTHVLTATITIGSVVATDTIQIVTSAASE